jgi:hypothetical protein
MQIKDAIQQPSNQKEDKILGTKNKNRSKIAQKYVQSLNKKKYSPNLTHLHSPAR